MARETDARHPPLWTLGIPMKIRYPLSFLATVALAIAIASLTVIWNLAHLLGLFVVLISMLALPHVARWEDRYARWVSHQ